MAGENDEKTKEKICPCCGPTVLMDFRRIGKDYYKWICKVCGNEILSHEDGTILSQTEYKEFLREADNWN